MSITEKKNIFNSLLPNRKLWYICSAKKAFDKASELFPNSTHNGKGDAFRHALWNGYCYLTMEGNLGEQLTSAHENKPSPFPNYPFPEKEKEMDLYNNNQGRLIAMTSNLSNVSDHIIENLHAGFLRHLSNLGTFVSADGSVYPNLPTVNSVLIPTN